MTGVEAQSDSELYSGLVLYSCSGYFCRQVSLTVICKYESDKKEEQGWCIQRNNEQKKPRPGWLKFVLEKKQKANLPWKLVGTSANQDDRGKLTLNI